MLTSLKVFALAGSPPHYQVALGFLAYAVIEFWLGRTRFVQANSTLEAGANLAKAALLDRIPLLGRVIKALATPAAVLVFLGATLLPSCATSQTKPGATLVDKLHDDEAAFKTVENDVKTQCGPQFAPIGVLASAVLAVVSNASAGNYVGAVSAAVAALPDIVADAQALACVEHVIAADYKLFKPGAAPAAPAPSAMRGNAWAMAVICDNRTARGSAICHPITYDGEYDPSEWFDAKLSTGRAVKVGNSLVYLDKDGEPRVVR